MPNTVKIGAGLLGLGMATAIQAMGFDGCIPAQPVEFGGADVAPAGTFSEAFPAASSSGTPSAPLPRRPEVNLLQPGRYCLAADIHQGKLLDRRHGREMKTPGGDAIVLVGADDVSLDLAGHRISNDRELGYTLLRHYRYEPGRGHFHAFVRTRIHNGRLFSPGSRGVGIRLASSRAYDSPGFGRPVRLPQAARPADVFRDTGHVLEELEIEAGSRAILVDGSNNVIRNNRIVVDSATAIVAQGPGVLIENNLIEVRGNASLSPGSDQEGETQSPAVIRLIQADGALVRNNRVHLLDAGREDPLPAAIQLVASRHVVVEDNSLRGMQAVISADAASDYQEARNRLQPCAAGERIQPPDESGDTAVARLPSCRSRQPDATVSAPTCARGTR